MKPVVLLLAVLASVPACAQWLGQETPGLPRTDSGEPDLDAPPPRTPWGTPDFSGLYSPGGSQGIPPADDKIQPWMQALIEQRNRSFNSNHPRNLCLPNGPGYSHENTEVGTRRIVHSPDMIALLYADLKYRQIFLDGRELEDEVLLSSWMGYSVGHWEGDTLVVESNGYNDRTWLHRTGLGHTDQLRITERMTRTSYGTIEVEAIYDDPGTFTEPLEVGYEMRLIADDEMLEVVCNEASQGTSHYTGDFEDVEADLIEIPRETLEKYVGRYRGVYIDSTITVDVTLEDDGKLYLTRRGSKAELIPQGETTFIRGGWGFVFTVDDEGYATAISEVHVSGGWTFPRIE